MSGYVPFSRYQQTNKNWFSSVPGHRRYVRLYQLEETDPDLDQVSREIMGLPAEVHA